MNPVSVIIPNFNSGEFLRDCIESINSSTRPTEIIIVDDGSTDNSLTIAHELSNYHDNIRIIARQTNGGIAAARITGIEASTQDWIVFIDADDFIEKDAITVAFAHAVATDTDICIWDMWRYNDGQEWRHISLRAKDFPITGREAVLRTLGKWQIHPLGVLRKSIYEEAYQGFNESCTNSDELITRLLFSKANLVSYCDKKYYYRVNSSSSTQKLNPRRLSALDSYLWLYHFSMNYPEATSASSEIVLNAISNSWYFWKKRREIGVNAVKHKLIEFLPKLQRETKLMNWLWKHPKQLIAYCLVTILIRL